MKKALMTISTMALLSAAVPQANAGGGAIAAGVVGGLGAGLIIGSALQPRPVYAAPVYYAPAPVVVQQPAQVVYSQPVATVPQQVVVQAQPVVVQQPQVVYAPAPVYYAPAPVCYGRPALSFGFSFGHPYYHGHYRHW